jgi:hypothetical protein
MVSNNSTVPLFIYKNIFSDYEEYMYNDAYLVVYKEEENFIVFESDKKLNFENSEPSIYDEDDLNEIVNDVQRFKLVYHNPNFDSDQYSSFLLSL